MTAHVLPITSQAKNKRPHLCDRACWCRPVLRWRHEIETHNGDGQRVWQHHDVPSAVEAGGEGG